MGYLGLHRDLKALGFGVLGFGFAVSGLGLSASGQK